MFGEHGTVKLGGTSTNNIDVWAFEDEQAEDAKNQNLQEATSNVYGNGHTSLYADVIDAIEHDRQPYVDAVDVMRWRWCLPSTRARRMEYR